MSSVASLWGIRAGGFESTTLSESHADDGGEVSDTCEMYDKFFGENTDASVPWWC